VNREPLIGIFILKNYSLTYTCECSCFEIQRCEGSL